MLKTWSEKLKPKFAATTPGCSVVKVVRLDDAFLEVFFNRKQAQQRPITAAKGKKRRKRKGQKKFQKSKSLKTVGHFFLKKPSQNFDFCACPSQNVANRDASGKKAKLS